jgi:hypothetical protein
MILVVSFSYIYIGEFNTFLNLEMGIFATKEKLVNEYFIKQDNFNRVCKYMGKYFRKTFRVV